MSITYTPTTNFGAKDSLPANDPAKVIKGADFTTEYSAIQSAFALAAPASNPTFTGTANFADVSITNDLTVDTDTLVVDSTNNRVGISTASPAAPLDVFAGANERLKVTTVSGNLALISSNAADSAYQPIELQASSFALTQGSVGIGTASPNRTLTVSSSSGVPAELVSSSSNSLLAFFDAGTGVRPSIGSEGSDLIFSANGERMRVDDSGNVGIGTSSPSFITGSGLEIQRSSATATMRLEYTGSNAYEVSAESSQVTHNSISSLPIAFEVGSTERMRIDSTGNVGIGIASPSESLEVSNTGSDARILVTASGTAGLDTRIIARSIGNGGPGRGVGISLQPAGSANSVEAVKLVGLQEVTSTTANSAAFAVQVANTSGTLTERVRIDSSGNVGIGTTNPSSKLTVLGDTYIGGVGTNLPPTLSLVSTISSGASANTDLTLGVANDTAVNVGAVYQYSLGVGGGAGGQSLTFNARVRDGSTTERMRIDSSGNLLVGATSTPYAHILQSNNISLTCYRPSALSTGSIAVFQSDIGGTQTVQCSIRGDGDLENTNNSYGGLSDARLKSDIVDASPQLDDIMAVKVRSYTLNATGDKHIGVVAQELEEVGMGGLVKTDEEGMKSVKYSVLYMKAIKAIQEQQEMIESLKAKVEALENA